MDAENLRLITETLKTLGEAGLTGFISWLVLEKVVPVIAWISSLVIVAKMLIIPIAKIIQEYNVEKARLARERDASNVSANYMSGLRDMINGFKGGSITFAEAHITFEFVADLLKKERVKAVSEAKQVD